MKARNILYSIAAGLFGLSSCIYPYDPDINKETDQTIVIEGEILIGGTSTIRLSYLTDLEKLSESVTKPQGKAWVEDRDGKRYLPATDIKSSTINIPMNDAVNGTQYRAVIEVEGQTYASDWLDIAPPPTILDVYFDADDTRVTVYADIDAEQCRSGYLGFGYEETWEFHSDFLPEYTVNPEDWSYAEIMTSWPYYWCYRSSQSKQMVLLDYTTLDGAQPRKFPVFNFLRTDSRNHRRYSVLLKAFALSRDAYLYNKQTQNMSDVGGDLFSPEPGMLQGNLTCLTDENRQVMGLVLAAEVASKRVFLDSRYLKYLREDETVMKEVAPQDMYRYYYNLNYRPIRFITVDGQDVMGWAPHRCSNCVEAGGTQEKPSFWNEN